MAMRTCWITAPRGYRNFCTIGIADSREQARQFRSAQFHRITRQQAIHTLRPPGGPHGGVDVCLIEWPEGPEGYIGRAEAIRILRLDRPQDRPGNPIKPRGGLAVAASRARGDRGGAPRAS